MQCHSERQQLDGIGRRCALWGAVCVLVVDLVLLTTLSFRAPELLSPSSLEKDSRGYFRRALNLKEHFVFSASAEEPRFPDMVRTPGYPFVVALFTTRNSLLPLFLLQSLLDAATCLMVGKVARSLGGGAAEWWAVALYALNPTLRFGALSVMTECLFNFGLMLVVTIVVRGVQRADIAPHPAFLLLSGFMMALLTLVRPTGKYVFLMALATLVIVHWRRATASGIARKLLLVTLGFTLGVGGWILRNQVIFRCPMLSLIESQNLVYYVGGGAFSVQRRIDFSEAREAVAKEFEIPTYGQVHNPCPPASVRPDLDRLLAVRNQVLTRYPGALANSLGQGLFRGLIAHDADSLAQIVGTQWKPSGLLSGGKRGQRANSGNPLWLIGSALAMAAVNALMVFIGLFACISRATWRSVASVFCAGLSGMFLAMIMPFSVAADSRARAPLLPILCVVGAVALAEMWGRWRRSVPQQSPSSEEPPVVA